MSNHLISEVYKRQTGGLARNAVMVLLADKASDDGTGIWASKQRMADELGTTKQTVIATIKALITDGLLREDGQRKSPNGYTVEYAINVAALQALPLVAAHQSSSTTGKAASPVKHVDRSNDVTPPVKQLDPNPPKPPVYGLSDDKPKRASAPAVPCPPDVNEQVWKDFVQHRRSKRAAITETALAGIKREADKAGWTLNAALTECAARGWTGFNAKWVQDQTNDRQSSSSEYLRNLSDRAGRQPARNDEIQNSYVRAALERQAERAGAGGDQSDCWP